MTPSPKKQPNRWLALINMPIQMGAIIFIFSFFGQWLDEKYGVSQHWYTKGFTLLGVFVAMYTIIRQVKKMDKNES
ncbi:AtpZ/AtpI family protein [Flavobacterium sp.]|jgi:F0F1-type ATP synthase assembly protein I|uniref:AtpZ/AtpI family protein n=1 Tax=Flavobacterium sp. TaxID=239 RepID=UPI00260A55AA|nr:AtpZ/AtpI family protein [Flavobacterium sp.]